MRFSPQQKFSDKTHFLAMATPMKRRKANPTPAVMRITREKAAMLLAVRKRGAVLISNGESDERLHCLVDQGMLQNGYPSVSWSHTEANIQVSHLVLRVEKGDDQVPHRARRETASHLCHNKRCIRSEHIIKEAIGLNSRRNGCLAFVFASNGERISACGHVPKCLLPSPHAEDGDEE